MKKKILILIASVQILFAYNYEAPPSKSTSGSVPVISDESMEICVKNYNKAKWLKKELDTTYVDKYSQESVNNYNNKVRKHSDMIRNFNRDCAGKQSYSAHKTAQKLNRR